MIRLIVLARKPLGKKSVAENVLEHGTGGLNIDATRIACAGENPSIARRKSAPAIHYEEEGRWKDRRSPETYSAERAGEKLGRWPSNIILQHKAGCRKAGTQRVKPQGGSGRTGPGARGFQTSYVGGEKKGEGFTGSYVDDDGLEAVDVWECVEGCPIQDLSEQSGGSHPAGNKRNPNHKIGNKIYGALKPDPRNPDYHPDIGTASRFFKQVQGKK
jgi:hypothetical protein